MTWTDDTPERERGEEEKMPGTSFLQKAPPQTPPQKLLDMGWLSASQVLR